MSINNTRSFVEKKQGARPDVKHHTSVEVFNVVSLARLFDVLTLTTKSKDHEHQT